MPEEEAGSAQFGNRNLQVNYFIGKAYQALNKKTKAKEYFKKSTESSSERLAIMNYYQGLSCLELNYKEKANEIFEAINIQK